VASAADPGPHPNTPRTGALVAVFGAVVVAGVLGALIGWGLVRAGCDEEARLGHRLLEAVAAYHGPSRSCAAVLVGGALAGALVAAAGTGVVAVLLLRAQSEWRAHPPQGPSTRRRNPSA
jgi:hypothetical protein